MRRLLVIVLVRWFVSFPSSLAALSPRSLHTRLSGSFFPPFFRGPTDSCIPPPPPGTTTLCALGAWQGPPGPLWPFQPC